MQPRFCGFVYAIERMHPPRLSMLRRSRRCLLQRRMPGGRILPKPPIGGSRASRAVRACSGGSEVQNDEARDYDGAKRSLGAPPPRASLPCARTPAAIARAVQSSERTHNSLSTRPTTRTRCASAGRWTRSTTIFDRRHLANLDKDRPDGRRAAGP